MATQPTPTAATRLEKLSAGIGRIVAPSRRLEAANALLDAVPSFAGELRAIRAGAIRELKEGGLTWAAIGEELGVSPQRAQQMAAELHESSSD